MEFNLSGKITFEDYLAFYKYHFKHLFFDGWKKFVLFFLVIVFVFAMIYIRSYFAIIIVFVFIMLFLFFTKKELKKQFNSNKFFTEEQFYLITIDKIEIKTESSSVVLTNDKINKILYNKNAIYIFISSQLAYVLPKSFFKNNDFDIIKNFVEENYAK